MYNAFQILRNIKENKNSKIQKRNKSKCKKATWTFLF